MCAAHTRATRQMYSRYSPIPLPKPSLKYVLCDVPPSYGVDALFAVLVVSLGSGWDVNSVLDGTATRKNRHETVASRKFQDTTNYVR
jgi:hypothetical protein